MGFACWSAGRLCQDSTWNSAREFKSTGERSLSFVIKCRHQTRGVAAAIAATAAQIVATPNAVASTIVAAPAIVAVTTEAATAAIVEAAAACEKTGCASDLLQDTLATLHVAVWRGHRSRAVGQCDSEAECQAIRQGERVARLTASTLSLHNSGQVYWQKSDYQITHDICCSTKQEIHRTVYTLVCHCHLANITTEVTPRTWARMPVLVHLAGSHTQTPRFPQD